MSGRSNSLFNEVMGVEVASAIRASAFYFKVFEEMDAMGNTTTMGASERWGVLGEIKFANHANGSGFMAMGADARVGEYRGLTIRTHN